MTSNYVLVECFALLQRRLGLEAARAFQSDVVGVLLVRWVDEQLHAAGPAALLIAGRRQLSLVDCVSFELMRRLGLLTAFAFDQGFTELLSKDSNVSRADDSALRGARTQDGSKRRDTLILEHTCP